MQTELDMRSGRGAGGVVPGAAVAGEEKEWDGGGWGRRKDDAGTE